MSQSSIKIYTIQRKNPITGFKETINYTGNIKSKPKGWKVIKVEFFSPYIDEYGLTGKY